MSENIHSGSTFDSFIAEQNLPIADTNEEQRIASSILEKGETVSPDEAEKELLKQASLGNPEDQAAAMFGKHQRRLLNYLPHMSKNQLQRIILHAALYPFFESTKKIKGDKEATVAHDIEELMLCKMIMKMSVGSENMNENMDLEKESLTEVVESIKEANKQAAESAGE